MAFLDLAVSILEEIGYGCRAARRANRPSATHSSSPSRPLPPASTPTIRTSLSSRKGWKMPMALDPPPTAAMTMSGRRLENLFAGFRADHRLEITHHFRIGMRTGCGADHVIGVVDIGDPGRAAPRSWRPSACAPPPAVTGRTSAPSSSMKDVRRLTFDVGRAHIDDARQAKAGSDGGRRHAMLAGAEPR